MMMKLQMDYDDLQVEYTKASNSEKAYLVIIKENKKVLKTLKNKIIEIEGVVRDFKLFEKVFAMENSKTQKQLEAKDKEITALKERNSQLEETSGEY